MASNLAMIVGGVALLGAGYLLAPRGAPAPAPPQPAAELSRGGAGTAGGLTETDVRRVLRQELAAMPTRSAPLDAASDGGAASDRRATSDEGEPAPLSPAATASLQAAHDRIERARTTKQWNRDDASALATTLELLQPAQRDELLSTLVPALNRGEIQLTYPGPIFQ